MVAALATDQTGARAFAAQTLVLQRDLERRFDGLGARVHEEHMVHAGRSNLDDAVGQLEGQRMTHLERRRKVHLCQRLAHGLGDLGAAVTGVDAPQTRHAVENLTTFRSPIVHTLGARQQARLGLVIAVGRERHPVGFKSLTGHRAHVQCVENVGHGLLLGKQRQKPQQGASYKGAIIGKPRLRGEGCPHNKNGGARLV